MPSTWETYGVDANGDGVADPSNPEDAIFAAARYLKAAGMPQNTYGAIFAYNHAGWYVAEVLANASCYGSLGDGTGGGGGFALPPQMPVLALPAGAGMAGADPGRIHARLRERCRPLWTRSARRLGARRGGQA